MLENRHLVQPDDFTVEEIDSILDLGMKIKKTPEDYTRVCEGKLLATLFYEPPTRTRLSLDRKSTRLNSSH